MAPLVLFLLLASSLTSVFASSQHGMKHRQDVEISVTGFEPARTVSFQPSASLTLINADEPQSTPVASTESLGVASLSEVVSDSETVQPPSATTTYFSSKSEPAAPSTTALESPSVDASLSSSPSTIISLISTTSASVAAVTAGPAPVVLTGLKRTSTSVSASKTSSVALPSRAASASASASATAAQTGAAQRRGEMVEFLVIAVVAGFVGSWMI